MRDARRSQRADGGLGVREPVPSIGEALVNVFARKVEPTLIQPTLVFGHPVEISPLAKPMAEDPRYVERFEIFIAGMECGDNWSEQNDPVQLLETWRKAYRAEDRDSGKFHTLDFDFIEALEYGMPPTTGIGPGIERMAMIFTEQENIDDVIFSPMMRPLISPVNRIIYNVPETRRSGSDRRAARRGAFGRGLPGADERRQADAGTLRGFHQTFGENLAAHRRRSLARHRIGGNIGAAEGPARSGFGISQDFRGAAGGGAGN